MSVITGLWGGLLIAAGLLLPGAGWALTARWPLPWFAAGVLSVLAIFLGVVAFACLGFPITLATLATWLGVVAAGGFMCWWRRKPPATETETKVSGWWIALPVLPMLLVAAWRAVTQPLPGVDVDFRWHHLAHLIVETGRLDFYPAATAEAFAQYFWADGIAPLVSGVYVWTYLAAGGMAKVWTAIPVLLQFLGLLVIVHSLSRQWWPEVRAGWFACALSGGTMLLQFAFNLGQETGFTALGVGGVVFYLQNWGQRGGWSLLIPAALAAALVACAREYGAVFILAGAAWIAVQRRGWRAPVLFAGIAGFLPLVWHLRVWYLTGNPLYAHDVAGLFPVNPVFHAWMQGYAETYGRVFFQAGGWKEIGRLFVISTLPAIGGLAVGCFIWRRAPGAGLWLLMAVLAAAVWLLSVPFTAGGLFYSMRVLSPILLLGCAWGGAALARWVPRRRHLAGVLLGLGLFGVDAGLRALTIPLNPYATAWRDWPDAGYRWQADFARENELFAAAAANRAAGRVLSESAGMQHHFQRRGKTLSPLWSPEVQFLFSSDFKGVAATRLQELGYTHILLTRVQSSVDFLTRTGALQRLDGHLEPVMANDTFILFELRSEAPEPDTK